MEEAFNTDKIISEAMLTKLERTGAHSHIRGLGLDDMLTPKEVSLSLTDCFILLTTFYRTQMAWWASCQLEKLLALW